jgi:hypothetical protein
MPTPQFNVRVPEQYHDLLRLIVERLRTNPDGADALAAALSAVCRQSAGRGAISADNLSAAASGDFAALLQAMQEKLALQEQTTLKLMAMVENIADRVKALEQPAEPKAAKPRQSRPAAADKRRFRSEGRHHPVHQRPHHHLEPRSPGDVSVRVLPHRQGSD